MMELTRAFREGWQTETYNNAQGRFRRFGHLRCASMWAWNRLRERISYTAAPWLHADNEEWVG